MNNSLLTGIIVGGVAITSIGGYASTRVDLNPWRDYAEVIAVEPAYDNRMVGRQCCNDESVTRQVPGNQISEGNTESTIGQRCGTVYNNEKIRGGYEVTYLLDGKQGVVRMDRAPGNRFRIENGEPLPRAS